MWNIVTLVPWDLTPLCTLIVRHQQKPRDAGVGTGKAKPMKIPQKEPLSDWQDMQTGLPPVSKQSLLDAIKKSQNSLDTIVLSEYWLIANSLLED